MWVLPELFTFILLGPVPVDPERLNVPGTIISKLFLAALVYLLSVIWKQKSHEAMPNKLYLYLLCVPAGTVCIAVMQYYSNENSIVNYMLVRGVFRVDVILYVTGQE